MGERFSPDEYTPSRQKRVDDVAAVVTMLETSLDLFGPYTVTPTDDGVKVSGRDSRGRFASTEIVEGLKEDIAA